LKKEKRPPTGLFRDDPEEARGGFHDAPSPKRDARTGLEIFRKNPKKELYAANPHIYDLGDDGP